MLHAVAMYAGERRKSLYNERMIKQKKNNEEPELFAGSKRCRC